MKNKWYLILFTILLGCAGSPTRTAFEADKHRMDMMDMKTNMSMEEVRDRMGVPKKIERRAMNGIEYEIWYYMTKGVNIDQTRFIDENFTPFVFYGTCLRGWGWKFYNHLFDINNARFKKEEDTKKLHYEPSENNPDYQHRIITPYKGEKKGPVEESLEKFIKSAEENKTQPLNKNIPQTEKTPANIPPSTEQTDQSKQKPPGEGLEVIHKPVEQNGIPTGQTIPTIIKEKPLEVPPKVGGQPSGSTTTPNSTPGTTNTSPVPGVTSSNTTNESPLPSLAPEKANPEIVPNTNPEESGLNSSQKNEIVPEVNLPPNSSKISEEPSPQKFNWW